MAMKAYFHENLGRWRISTNEVLHLTAIPLRFIVAGELYRLGTQEPLRIEALFTLGLSLASPTPSGEIALEKGECQ